MRHIKKVKRKKIYDSCENKSTIIFDIYKDSIRGFITLMNGYTFWFLTIGTVHIAKALKK